MCSRLAIQPNGPNKAENHAFKYNHNLRLPPHKVLVYTFYLSMLSMRCSIMLVSFVVYPCFASILVQVDVSEVKHLCVY